jgi:hypothetical protein
MKTLILNAIRDLENTTALLTKALDKEEYRETITSIIEIHNDKIMQLNKLLDCKFADFIILDGCHYYMNNENQFLTSDGNRYVILGYGNVKFKVYIRNGIISTVIPCNRLSNDNLTMFGRVHDRYSNYKRMNERELLKFVVAHTCAQLEVIEEE